MTGGLRTGAAPGRSLAVVFVLAASTAWADGGASPPGEAPAASAPAAKFEGPPPLPPAQLWHRLLHIAELKRRDVDVAHVEKLLELHFPAANHVAPKPAAPDEDEIYGIDYVQGRRDWYFNVGLAANDASASLFNFNFDIAIDARTGRPAIAPTRAYCIDAEQAKADVAHAGWRLANRSFSDAGLHGDRSGLLLVDYLKGNRTLRLTYTTPLEQSNLGECVGQFLIMQGAWGDWPAAFGDLPEAASPMDVVRNLGEEIGMGALLYPSFYSDYPLHFVFHGDRAPVAPSRGLTSDLDVTLKTLFTAGKDASPLTLRLRSKSPVVPSSLPAGDPTATVDVAAMAPFGLRLADVEQALRPGATWTRQRVHRDGPGASVRESRTRLDGGDDTLGEITLRATPGDVVDAIHVVLRVAP